MDLQENDLLSLEVTPDTSVNGLKQRVEAEVRIPIQYQHLWLNGQLLSDDSKSMEQLSISDNDMLSLHVRDKSSNVDPQPDRRVAAQPQSQRQAAAANTRRPQPGAPDPELIRLQILGSPEMRREVLRTRPDLGAAIDDPERFAAAYNQLQGQARQEELARAREIEALNADPFDIEAQMKIAEIIRAEQVQENLQNAMEHNPEVFGRVNMLYIDVEVNGHKVKAFVDSGAQATIMSPSCAESCNIMRLIDKRYAGVARGVGTANILGRVHSAQIRIGSLFLPCSFTVMEGKDVDLLLGLDMLKRHQAILDLSRDKLVIQGVEVPFLGESDIPKNMEEAFADEPVVKGPGGTTIGTKTGAVTAPTAGPSTSGAPSTPTPQATPNVPAAAPFRPPPAATFSKEAVDQLVALGFSEAEATRALQACDGNVEYAAGLLFQG